MRLYLASNDLGNFADKLRELVGDNKKALVISNARDHRSKEDRAEIVKGDIEMLNAAGLSAMELDLRPYFGKADELRKYIDAAQPGLVFSMGGNFCSLATAMHLSGMRDILRKDLADDKYVYGGYSAGAMIAAPDTLNYLDSYGRRTGDRLEEAKQIYGEAYTEGLGLINEYICPHADEDRFMEVCEKAQVLLPAKGLTPVVLNNSDVMVIDGEQKVILKK